MRITQKMRILVGDDTGFVKTVHCEESKVVATYGVQDAKQRIQDLFLVPQTADAEGLPVTQSYHMA